VAELTPQQQAIIDRGQRLLELRHSPGFFDVMTISQKLADETRNDLLRFDGWDKDRLLGLQKRADGALEHHARLVQVIEETVQLAVGHAMTGQAPSTEPEFLDADQRDELQSSFLAGVE
jgi:hypothetical protein